MDRANIKHDAVKIGVEFFAEENIVTVIAAETGFNISAIALTEEFRQYGFAFGFFFQVLNGYNDEAAGGRGAGLRAAFHLRADTASLPPFSVFLHSSGSDTPVNEAERCVTEKT